jgi:hypothetical protein
MVGRGTGSELHQPLGYAIVGGLALSQALTLYTTPVVYLYLDRLQTCLFRKRKVRHEETVEAEAAESRWWTKLGALHRFPVHSKEALNGSICALCFVQVFSRRQRQSHHALRRPAAEKRQGTKSRASQRERTCRRDRNVAWFRKHFSARHPLASVGSLVLGLRCTVLVKAPAP